MASPRASEALSSSVLVLNRLYQAVHVIGVRRAFRLLCRELAEVVHQEGDRFANYDFQEWRELSEWKSRHKQPDEDWIRSVHFEIRVPRVIRLLKYDRLPSRSLRLNRNTIFARDEHRCQYCGERFGSSELSLDHVIPRSRGGGTTWENVVCACVACNVRKGGRTPQEAHMKLFSRPVRPKRSPLLLAKLRHPKYASWKTWLDASHGEVGALSH